MFSVKKNRIIADLAAFQNKVLIHEIKFGCSILSRIEQFFFNSKNYTSMQTTIYLPPAGAVENPSQWQAVLSRLETGKSITQFEAFTELGIGHLARRILTLKEKGYPVGSRWIEVQKGNGQSARVKQYFLKNLVEA